MMLLCKELSVWITVILKIKMDNMSENQIREIVTNITVMDRMRRGSAGADIWVLVSQLLRLLGMESAV